MDKSAETFEKLKRELSEKLESLETDFPDAESDIAVCRELVDLFCNIRSPATTDAEFAIRQTATKVRAQLNSTWNRLNRSRIATS